MKKILVCDDDEGISEVIRIILEGANYQVNSLNSGHAIQKKIQQYEPDVILLDMWMPGIEGKEIIIMLKRSKNLSHIPIIVVSALSNTKDISRKYGADDFLEKPFDTNKLLSLVEKYAKA